MKSKSKIIDEVVEHEDNAVEEPEQPSPFDILCAAVEHIGMIAGFSNYCEYVPADSLRDDEQVNVAFNGAQIKAIRAILRGYTDAT
jgi:hypothetical protein